MQCAAPHILHFNSPWAAVPLVLNTLAIRVATYQIIVLLPTSYYHAKCPVQPISHIRPCTSRSLGTIPLFISCSLSSWRVPSSLPSPVLPSASSPEETEHLHRRACSRRSRFYERIVKPSVRTQPQVRPLAAVPLAADRGSGVAHWLCAQPRTRNDRRAAPCAHSRWVGACRSSGAAVSCALTEKPRPRL